MIFNFFKRKKEQVSVENNVVEEKKPEETKKELPNYKKPLQEIESKVDQKIINVMKTTQDPELGIDIWSLGLIYDADMKDNSLEIKMTFTSPMCPYGPELVSSVKKGLKEAGFESNVEVVFSPPWQPTDEIKEILGFSV